MISSSRGRMTTICKLSPKCISIRALGCHLVFTNGNELISNTFPHGVVTNLRALMRLVRKLEKTTHIKQLVAFDGKGTKFGLHLEIMREFLRFYCLSLGPY